ncbi:MAG: hypothetical protein KGL35_17155, partial [Bradyrhizobium sp.]|nr:hypothetical protein [Bradyrhizobium sp.]
AEQEQRTTFMREFVPFLEQILPVAQGNPALADLAESMTLFVMRPFKVARTLEETVTKAFAALKQMPPVPPKGAQGTPKSSADSPQDLAVRNADIQSRAQIAQQTNAVKMVQIQSQERMKEAELALDAKVHHDTLAEGISREADQRAYRDVRTNALEAREAGALQ